MTRTLAVMMLVIGYVMHKEWIPPGASFHIGPVGPISVAGLLTDAMALFAALGISGPQTWPWMAKLLGNPGTPKPPAV
jgi:hypothetical protein